MCDYVHYFQRSFPPFRISRQRDLLIRDTFRHHSSMRNRRFESHCLPFSSLFFSLLLRIEINIIVIPRNLDFSMCIFLFFFFLSLTNELFDIFFSQQFILGVSNDCTRCYCNIIPATGPSYLGIY